MYIVISAVLMIAGLALMLYALMLPNYATRVTRKKERDDKKYAQQLWFINREREAWGLPKI